MKELVVNRLKNIITKDKSLPNNVERILCAEIYNVIKDFFEISMEDICVDILINEENKFDIQINIVSRAFKSVTLFN